MVLFVLGTKFNVLAGSKVCVCMSKLQFADCKCRPFWPQLHWGSNVGSGNCQSVSQSVSQWHKQPKKLLLPSKSNGNRISHRHQAKTCNSKQHTSKYVMFFSSIPSQFVHLTGSTIIMMIIIIINPISLLVPC